MQGYKTVEEKSQEWKISTRYIQNLCKGGYIEGAIKKAGIWHIPEDTKSPAKRKPTQTKKFAFSGTKKKIFKKSMGLFIEHGYENVSMRIIAGAVGIKQAAIYNHFTSKREILDTVYDFFSHHFCLDRPSLEDIRPIIKTGSLMDILMSGWYLFNEDYREEMIDALKILLQRTAIDNRAKEIMKKELLEKGNNFMKEIFDMAVETGRLAPFDTHSMGVFVNAIRMYSLQNWLIDDSLEHSMEVARDEGNIYEHALKLLTDLAPPEEKDTIVNE